MGVKTRVAVLRKGEEKLCVEVTELPELRPHQVLVRQCAAGVCHTQLHQMDDARRGTVLLGHESSGTVLAAGAEVSAVDVGDEVLSTWIPCRPVTDRQVERADVVLADGSQARAAGGVFTWADNIVIDEAFVVRLPPGVPANLASVVGCAVMTGAGTVINTARVLPGQSIAIIGMGGVGLSAVGAAALAGANPVIAIDLDPRKLDLAKRFGASHVIDASQEDAVTAILRITHQPGHANLAGRPSDGVDFALDCVGSEQTIRQALESVTFGSADGRPAGMAILVGMPRPGVTLDVGAIFRGKGIRGSIAGGCRPDRDFPAFASWHADGRFDLNTLVTDRFTLAEINEATEALRSGRVLGRAIITFSP
jgi:Zn-dependent alcohol dehydrogenase